MRSSWVIWSTRSAASLRGSAPAATAAAAVSNALTVGTLRRLHAVRHQRAGGDDPEPPGPVVVDRLLQLVPCVHDERAVLGDGLTDGLAAEHDELHGSGRGVGRDGEEVARSEHGEL